MCGGGFVIFFTVFFFSRALQLLVYFVYIYQAYRTRIPGYALESAWLTALNQAPFVIVSGLAWCLFINICALGFSLSRPLKTSHQVLRVLRGEGASVGPPDSKQPCLLSRAPPAMHFCCAVIQSGLFCGLVEFCVSRLYTDVAGRCFGTRYKERYVPGIG